MLRAQGRLFDAGGLLLAIGGAIVLVVAGLQIIALAYVNSKWPPVPLRQIEAEAVARSSVALKRINAPNLLLQVKASAVQAWLQPELQKAVAKLNESRPDIQLRVDDIGVEFESQRGAISGTFELHLPERGLSVKGSIEGLAFLSLDGNVMTVRPALSKLILRSVHDDSDRHWWTLPLLDLLYAELLLVRDNINGQLPTYIEPLPVAPVTLPGEPRPNLPIVFPDPFHANATITENFVPPVLKGAALLATDNSVTVLGQLSLSDVPAPDPGATGSSDFLILKREFQSRQDASGLQADPASSVSFDVAASFINEMFAKTIGQVFTRDRVSAAVQASYDALPKLTHPDVGVSLDTPTVTRIVDQRLRALLDKWASEHSGTLTSAKFEVRPQYLWASASSAFDIADAGAQVEATVAVALPAAGTASGIRLYPAIDQLTVTKLHADSLGDLTGLLRGVNTFLASAIAAANAALLPVDVGLDPLKLDPIDFRSMASSPGLSVSPPTYTPRALAFSNVALLLDPDRIMVMAQASPVVAVAQVAPPPVDFDTYRKAFQARWTDPFGDPALPGVAHAYIRTATVANYVNSTISDANLSLTASVPFSGKSVQSLDVGKIPDVKCRGLLDCPSCEWYNAPCLAWKAVCEATNAGATGACMLALRPARDAVNEILEEIGQHLGDLTTAVGGTVDAQAANIGIDLADDFSSVGVTTTIQANASVSADLDFDSNTVAGVLICPVGLGRFHHHVPMPSGEMHGRILPQNLAMHASIKTGLEPGANGGQRFAFLITPQDDITVSGSLDTQPYFQLRLVMLSMNIQCPVTAVIEALVPGLGFALSLLDIGQITALVTDAVAKDAVNGLPPSVKAIFLGQIEQRIQKPGPISAGFDLPVVRIGDESMILQPEITDGLIRLHLSNPR